MAVTISNISEKKLAEEKIINAYKDLKKAEESLKKLNNDLEKMVSERTKDLSISDERFNLLSRASNDAIWDWNLVDNKVWWNTSFKNIFGYENRAVEPGIESLFNHKSEVKKIRELHLRYSLWM
ncbi:MAG: PAS domain-containing protein [Bacteroidota bacterium]|nr:PAS domain-containing protein [Bacteroidota bacterium]